MLYVIGKTKDIQEKTVIVAGISLLCSRILVGIVPTIPVTQSESFSWEVVLIISVDNHLLLYETLSIFEVQPLAGLSRYAVIVIL